MRRQICVLAAVVGWGLGCSEPSPSAAVTAPPPPAVSADAGRDEARSVGAANEEPAGPVPATATPYRSVTTGRLAFQSDVAGRPKIFTFDVASGLVRPLTGGRAWRDESPRWSPDGQFIAFSSNRAHYAAAPESGEPDTDIYVMRADGSDVRRITTDPGNDHDPSWTPDGQWLVFSSDRASRGDLYRVRVADGVTERLTTNYVGRAIMPSVSPDGRQVAFAAQTLRVGAFWNFQVHLLDLAALTTTIVPASGGACWPSWSPDGQRLFSVQLDREPSSIQRRNLATGETATAFADATRWGYYPRVSPDGRWLVLSISPEHHEGEDWDLALVLVDDPSRVIPLTTGRGNDRLADWRPR